MCKRIAIIGFFAFDSDYNGGQENKTRALADLLKKKYGSENIECLDTLNWKSKPIKLLINTFKLCRKSDAIIMLPAHNGVKVFSRLLTSFSKRNTKLFYSVIGGWLPNLTSEDKKLSITLKKFDGIFVETNSMKSDLENQNFKNVFVVPNFKKLEPIKKMESKYAMPYKLCTFSRVVKEKGIEDAINIITKINKRMGKIVYKLDIYGKIDNKYEKEFNDIMKRVPSYIKYKGVVPYNESVRFLKQYFALLFPTHFITEGVPGTIIDAYAAGVPVIAAKWNSFDDVIIENKTGIGYEFNNLNDLEKKLEHIANNSELIIKLKNNCLLEFNKYSEDYVSEIFDKLL